MSAGVDSPARRFAGAALSTASRKEVGKKLCIYMKGDLPSLPFTVERAGRAKQCPGESTPADIHSGHAMSKVNLVS